MHLVMFDVDGVLCDTRAVNDEIYFQAVKDILEIERPESLINFTHLTDPGILVELVMNSFEREITPREYSAVRDHFSDLIMEKLMGDPAASPEIAGALDIFAKLKESPECMVAVSTGGWGPTACFKLGTAGFDIDKVVMASADDDFDQKEIMKICHDRALKRAGIDEFESVTCVGSNAWSEAAAEERDWRFIGVGEHFENTENSIKDFIEIDASYFYNG